MSYDEQKKLMTHSARLQSGLPKDVDEQFESLFERYMLVGDSDIKAILKQDLVSKVQEVDEFVMQLEPNGDITKEKLSGLKSLLEEIKVGLPRSMRLTPYILVLSHLNRLSYIDKKQASLLIGEVRLMILRDLASMTQSEISASRNFYKAIEILATMGIYDSVEGWKGRLLTEQRRSVSFTEPEEGKKKGWWKFW